ncbi:membrane protein insertase YidC [Candidatus Latescibacterota bacterium]
MDRNLIFAVALTGLVMAVFLSPWYQNRFGHEIIIEQPAAPPPPGGEPGTTGVSRETTPPEESAYVPAEPRSAPPGEIAQVDSRGEEETVTIANDILRISISTRGGIITEATTLAYKGKTDDELAQLITPGEGWYGGSVTDGDLIIPFEELLFTVSGMTEKLTLLTALLSDGRSITRSYEFEDNGYLLHVETILDGPWVDPVVTYTWHGPINDTEEPVRSLRIWPLSMLMRDDAYTYSKVAYLGQGDRESVSNGGEPRDSRVYTDESQKIDAGRSRTGGSDTFSGELTWYGVRNKYFMTAAIPADRLHWEASATYEPVAPTKWYNFSLSKPVTTGSTALDCYIGPISYYILRDAGHQLTEIMELSWRFIRPISIAFLWLLTKLREFIPNWGLVILVFAVFIKIVLSPLSYKSYVSMRKMSLLQPLIVALREKHKNNPQKLHLETMDLYKREGVNPFSSCLPTLLQMPVFFALYPVVGRAFELRQAMFIPHWIEDLSRPDPFYIIPIAMGISMFFQMKPTMADPNQKMTLYIMPVIMTILFANFSSGLTLYWFLFTILSYFQQRMHKTA